MSRCRHSKTTLSSDRSRRIVCDVVVIGGGVIGSAIAHELSRYDMTVTVLEKHHDVAEGITKANSGVLHAGFMVPPGSLKARLNVEGRRFFPDLTDRLGVPSFHCRKLVIARDEGERKNLLKLLEAGKKNDVPGLSLIDSRRIRAIEPEVNARYALLSEGTSVILPYLLAIALAENAFLNGVEIKLNAEVTAITATQTDEFLVATAGGITYRTRMVINSAGLQAEQVGAVLEPPPERVHAWRGEYHLLAEESTRVVRTAVYPVPPKDGSGLGIHITPTVNGGILLGPSAEYTGSTEDTANEPAVLKRLLEEAHRMVPALRGIPVVKNYAGIRPKLFGPDSSVPFKDFFIQESGRYPGSVILLGIESPGLTAAPAIARYVLEQFVGPRLDPKPKRDWAYRYEPIPRTRWIDSKSYMGLIERDPAYGRILCHCERVSEAELRRALENPLQAVSLHGIRKRTHATLGKCQGGFCLGNIARLIEDSGYPFTAVGRGTPAEPVLIGAEPGRPRETP